MDSDSTGNRGVFLVGDAFEALDFAFREQPKSDFGIDAHAEPRSGSRGTGQLLALQIKTGDSYFREATRDGWLFRTDRQHAHYWIGHALPVLIVCCDLKKREAYWAAFTSANVEWTEKGARLLIPRNQTIDRHSLPAFRDLLTPVVPSSQYTIFSLRDVSTGAAKRYSLDIVLNSQLSKAEVASVIRTSTQEHRQSRYHRSTITRRDWGDHDADVVWTFVYASAEDCVRHNWICKSEWFRPGLEAPGRPESQGGENIGDSILVSWNIECVQCDSVDKQTYLDSVLPAVDEMESLLRPYLHRLGMLRNGNVTVEKFVVLSQNAGARIEELSLSMTEAPAPPFECEGLSARIQELSSAAGGMVIPHSEDRRKTCAAETDLRLAIRRGEDALEALAGIHYELRKIT